MIKIGKIIIDGAALAPMAGFTSSAFRQVCREMGAGLVVSEMISAKALCFGDKKTAELIKFNEGERPYALQLFGSEPDNIKKAAELLCAYNPDMIDINMGCPVPKIVGNGCGSAHLRDMDNAARCIEAAVCGSRVPISVKIRIGWDENSICAPEFAKKMQDAGAELITVHGRTREQMYRPGVNLDAIRAVKDAVSIPVIANGDIDSFESAQHALSYTGCDGVMIGRGALGNPFVFRKIKNPTLPEPSFSERMENLKHLGELEVQNKGERLAMLELRRHLPFFFKGMRDAAEIRRRSTTVCTFEDFLQVLELALEINS